MLTPTLTVLAASLLALGAAAPAAGAEPAPPAAHVVPLLTQALPDLPGREVELLTVEYLPGGASLPHRHDAHIFVYVLEGSLRMQVRGAAARTLRPGEVFYESPGDVHEVSANASATEPARFLVVALKDRGRPLTRPAPAAAVP
jgi:quercetin dioxygenase-like cupin family protein